MFFSVLLLYFLIQNVEIQGVAQGKMDEYFSWKQIGYNFSGIRYEKDSSFKKKLGAIIFKQDVSDNEKYFIQYNNVPIGLAIHSEYIFITVPRRRHGIPSTVNYVSRANPSQSPLLIPFPSPARCEELYSVYRPTVDRCQRLWVLDTGVLEAPDARNQMQVPTISVYDLQTPEFSKILRYELSSTDLVNDRTSAGLTSITVEVGESCDDAFAYVTDLATESLLVFSYKDLESWTFRHPSFAHDPTALNFTVAGNVISWRDGLFSSTLSNPDSEGRRKLYYHPLVSTKEYSVSTDALKDKRTKELPVKLEGDKGPSTQSGTHAYHPATRTMFFANVAQDAILCWNVDKDLVPENVGIVAQDHQKLVYISDLKVDKDEVWVLVNQIPKFVFSTLDPKDNNFYVHRGNVHDLVKGTPCEPNKMM